MFEHVEGVYRETTCFQKNAKKTVKAVSLLRNDCPRFEGTHPRNTWIRAPVEGRLLKPTVSESACSLRAQSSHFLSSDERGSMTERTVFGCWMLYTKVLVKVHISSESDRKASLPGAVCPRKATMPTVGSISSTNARLSGEEVDHLSGAFSCSKKSCTKPDSSDVKDGLLSSTMAKRATTAVERHQM